MNKLMLLGLLLLTSCAFTEEYISSEYYEEIMSQTEGNQDMNMESSQILGTEVISETINAGEILGTSVVEEPREMLGTEIIDETVSGTIEAVPIEEKQNVQTITYEEALKQARNEGKVIMLTIRSTDCKYCDKMEVGTLSDSSVKDAISANFININYNQDLESLPLNLQEGATPMFIFVNTDEDIINMYPGVRTPKEFKEVLAEILTQ